MDVPQAERPAVLAFADFELHTEDMRLRRHGEQLPLSGRPLEVLAALAARPGRLLSKDDLLDAVWGHRHVSDSVLKVAINSLRAALGDDARTPRFVETVPRRGYRFVAALQAIAASRRAGPPALPSTPPVGNLPRPAAPLVGRDAALAALRQALAASRLVTLSGPAGVGKTRLALAAAPLDVPPDGAWVLHLDDLDSAGLLPATLANTLQLPPEAGADLPSLCRALAPMRLRLLLDNAEHLVQTIAELAGAVLAAAPGVQLLITSQWPLRVSGEQVLPLPPLALPPDPQDETPDPDSYAAAQLLCTRLRLQQPHWQPAPGDAGHIAALCRALEGLPLALELAAGRVPLLGLGGVRQRLDERFALLTRAPRNGAARHRSLSAALDWTCGLLSPAEQQALQQLAVFSGSFGVDAAEAVLAALSPGDDALALVASLHERSLFNSEAGADGLPRLRLFDSVRRHALARLAQSGPEAEQAARMRHLRWMRQHFEAAEEAAFWVPLARWLPPLLADMDSLRSALQFGLAPQAPAEARQQAQLLLAASMPFWVRGGHGREAPHWLQRALQPPPADEATARLLDHGQAIMAQYNVQADVASAQQAAERALPWLLHQGRKRQAFLNLAAQFNLTMRLQAIAPAALLRQMRELVEPHWTELQCRVLHSAEGSALRIAGDAAGYYALSERSVQALRALGATFECWPNELACAQALALQGRLDEACRLLVRTVQEVRAAGALRQQLHLVAMNAALRLWHGGEGMVATAREALRLLQAEDRVWWVADALAWAAWHDDRPADAQLLRAWADELLQRRGEARGPLFRMLHAQLGERLAGQPLPPAGPALLTDAMAIGLALGPGPQAG